MVANLKDLKRQIDEAFGPPQEAIKVMRELSSLMGKIEKLDKEALKEAVTLFTLVKGLQDSGGLDKVVNLIQALPQGEEGRQNLTNLIALLTDLGPKIEKLTTFAETLLAK